MLLLNLPVSRCRGLAWYLCHDDEMDQFVFSCCFPETTIYVGQVDEMDLSLLSFLSEVGLGLEMHLFPFFSRHAVRAVVVRWIYSLFFLTRVA